jgi:hypothetical protein
MTAREIRADCPRCQASGTISVRRVLTAKPLGTFSLAGAQIKVSAVESAVAECSACDLSVVGHLENATLSPDGRAFTGGHFVSTASAPKLTGSACSWYEGDPIEDVPDDYNGPCIHCHQPRDAHGPDDTVTAPYSGGVNRG